MVGFSKINCYFWGKDIDNNLQHKESNYKNYQFSLEKVEKMPKFIIKTHYKRPVLVYDINSNFIEEFPSIAETVKKYSRGVEKVLKGVQQQCKGYIFKYKE